MGRVEVVHEPVSGSWVREDTTVGVLGEEESGGGFIVTGAEVGKLELIPGL
jgi:hypothetical protein